MENNRIQHTLFNLKECHPVPEVAVHLSNILGVEVSQASVLRYALKGRLKLSVDFVNLAVAKCGRTVRYTRADLNAAFSAGYLPQDLDWAILPSDLAATLPDLPDEAMGEPIIYLRSPKIDDDDYITFDSKATVIDGVLDLPMIGAEIIDIEHRCQMLATDGVGINFLTLGCGALVQGPDGQIWELQERFDSAAYSRASQARQLALKQHIADNNIEAAKAEEILKQEKETREQLLERIMSLPTMEKYFAAGGLPEDCSLVVRTDVVNEFIKSINDASLTGKVKTKVSPSSTVHDWQSQARVIADECFDIDTRNNCRDSLMGYSNRVVNEMQKRGIEGPQGIINNANTVKREALQAKNWWRNKQK